MLRARLWFKCAAMHDPVTPVLLRPAVIGWEAKYRQVDLTIERPFKGEELLLRMKGWITADVKRVIEVMKKYGFIKILDDRDLVIELETQEGLEDLKHALADVFQDQVEIEKV